MSRPALGAAALACAALAAGSAPAAEVASCDSWIANARHVAWDDPTRTFAGGAIRLVALDTEGEPACCSAHLMVLFATADAPFLDCALVSQTADAGWAGLSLAGAEAAYDPATGLTVDVPVRLYRDAGTDPGRVSITIDRARGAVAVR